MTDCPNCAAYRAETRRMAVESGGTYELAQEPVQAQLEATERALAFERAAHRERCRLLYAASREITRLRPLVDSALSDLEQARVQLAGCSVIAFGHYEDPPIGPGTWGWSASYDDVKNLRDKYEALLTTHDETQ